MMRSMFSGVSGMKNHLVRMDVMGNNIANVNTTGFKSSRVTFQDMLSQTLRTGTAPISGSAGGINPAQVGLGMIVGTVDTLQTQGNLGATGKSTDMAIQGEGFFVLSDNAVTRTYSRDGAFDIGQDGDLVNPANGYRLQGWMADINGTINITPELTSINIPVGQTEIAQATSSARLTGNINAVATSSTQGTVARSGKLYSDAGVTAAVGATFLTDLQDGATGTILSSGDIITLSGKKGGVAFSAETKVVGAADFTTYQNLLDWVGQYYGIASGETYGAYSSGVSIDTGGEVLIQGNKGEGNALTSISMTATDSAGTTDKTAFNTVLSVLGNTVQDADGTSVASEMTVYDSQGVSHGIKVIYSRNSSNTWSWTADCVDDNSGGRCVTNDGAVKELVFSASGAWSSDTGTLSVDLGDAHNLSIDLDMTGLSQFSGTSGVSTSEQNGYPRGTLDKFSVGNSGVLTGIYTNGLTKTLGQIALARFANPGGLLKEGNNIYKQATNSGVAQIGAPGSGGRGSINNGFLEMSNVDLAETFTDMIVTQRGFQANSRIITTSDEMLQDLVNLKR